MKFAMNGAITIGTHDGANVEICREVGRENIFLFGLRAADVARVRASGYDPARCAAEDQELGAVLEWLGSGAFSGGDPDLFRPLLEALGGPDAYMVLADYRSYIECQEAVAHAWRDPERWLRMSILNTARMGFFSSDRAVAEYAREIWQAEPAPLSGEFAATLTR